MTAPEDVLHFGTDPSGRPIYLTRLAALWVNGLIGACKARGFAPTIVQGSWMSKAGGGATASAGYHDQGGPVDFRTWNLTQAQVRFLIREARRRGGAAWLRDATHGHMDPHVHVMLGWDAGPIDPSAAAQWRDYLDGGNGLTGRSHGPDYHWRPSPLVTSWSPPPRYKLTRGQAVDHALKDLTTATGPKPRLATIRKAAALLRSLPTWKAPRP